jgi:hypothetical protein
MSRYRPITVFGQRYSVGDFFPLWGAIEILKIEK